MNYEPGIGATDELSLRVSVATLARVVFQHPDNGEWMLAVERKATLHKEKVEVKSQPFGGAIRILDLDAIHNLIGDFHFDSERSRIERDFRLFIRPSSWSVLREFCIQHFSRVDDPILETDPARELIEEFHDALGISLQPEQYVSKPMTTVVEDEAAPTDNIHGQGLPTVRVYRIFEAHITDAALIESMLKNSADISHEDLCRLARNASQKNGEDRANAILTLPLKRISDFYLNIPLKERNAPILFEDQRLDETVSTVLDGIAAPKYRRIF